MGSEEARRKGAVMSDAIIFSAWLAVTVAAFAAYAVRELKGGGDGK